MDIQLLVLVHLQGGDQLPCPTNTVENNESVHVCRQGLILSMYSTPYRWIKLLWEGIGLFLQPIRHVVKQQLQPRTGFALHLRLEKNEQVLQFLSMTLRPLSFISYPLTTATKKFVFDIFEIVVR